MLCFLESCWKAKYSFFYSFPEEDLMYTIPYTIIDFFKIREQSCFKNIVFEKWTGKCSIRTFFFLAFSLIRLSYKRIKKVLKIQAVSLNNSASTTYETDSRIRIAPCCDCAQQHDPRSGSRRTCSHPPSWTWGPGPSSPLQKKKEWEI